MKLRLSARYMDYILRLSLPPFTAAESKGKSVLVTLGDGYVVKVVVTFAASVPLWAWASLVVFAEGLIWLTAALDMVEVASVEVVLSRMAGRLSRPALRLPRIGTGRFPSSPALAADVAVDSGSTDRVSDVVVGTDWASSSAVLFSRRRRTFRTPASVVDVVHGVESSARRKTSEAVALGRPEMEGCALARLVKLCGVAKP